MQRVEIRIEGRQDSEWTEWFKDLTCYPNTFEVHPTFAC